MGTVFMVNVANMKFCVSVFKFDIHNNLTLYYDIYDMHDYIDTYRVSRTFDLSERVTHQFIFISNYIFRLYFASVS